MNATYHAQVDLLLRVLPHVTAEPDLALKGGTAINLFVRDMPRLSVDLDLTYLPVQPREQSLRAITEGLQRISSGVTSAIQGARVTQQGNANLVISTAGATVKVEANTTIRGSVYAPREMDLCKAAQDEFGRFVTTMVVSDGELFGGKLIAALDRQHPRDLFDTRYVLDTHSMSDEQLRLGFLAMLLSHDRPPHEVLRPNVQDPTAPFAGQFAGMARVPFTLEDHLHTLDELIASVPALLPVSHRQFLATFFDGEPDPNLLRRPDILDLPAIRWKLGNLLKLRQQNPAKHAAQAESLRRVLDDMPST